MCTSSVVCSAESTNADFKSDQNTRHDNGVFLTPFTGSVDEIFVLSGGQMNSASTWIHAQSEQGHDVTQSYISYKKYHGFSYYTAD